MKECKIGIVGEGICALWRACVGNCVDGGSKCCVSMAIMQTVRRCDHQSEHQTTGLSDRQCIGHQTTRPLVHQVTNSSELQTT